MLTQCCPQQRGAIIHVPVCVYWKRDLYLFVVVCVCVVVLAIADAGGLRLEEQQTKEGLG